LTVTPTTSLRRNAGTKPSGSNQGTVAGRDIIGRKGTVPSNSILHPELVPWFIRFEDL
jgi:hypothetical protein